MEFDNKYSLRKTVPSPGLPFVRPALSVTIAQLRSYLAWGQVFLYCTVNQPGYSSSDAKRSAANCENGVYSNGSSLLPVMTKNRNRNSIRTMRF